MGSDPVFSFQMSHVKCHAVRGWEQFLDDFKVLVVRHGVAEVYPSLSGSSPSSSQISNVLIVKH